MCLLRCSSHTRSNVLTLLQIGPVAGAYLAAAEGWRWTFWLIAIAVSGVMSTVYLACSFANG